jgi:hypothetical protein
VIHLEEDIAKDQQARESLFAKVFKSLLQQNRPQADSYTAAKKSFNQLVGAVEELRRDGQAEGLCGL